MNRNIFEYIYNKWDAYTSNALNNMLDNKDLLKLSINDLKYLDLIRLNPNITPVEISKKLNISKPSVTYMIEKLERVGAVKKIKSKEDKRSYCIVVTDESKKIMELEKNIFIEHAVELVKKLNFKEREQLYKLFCKMELI